MADLKRDRTKILLRQVKRSDRSMTTLAKCSTDLCGSGNQRILGNKCER
ncbi:MAG: hypothetical protein M3O33_15540 [Cyanobacteriota bacterium]|nr:hypothetical protein [Cyanobacteriota bacterium]